MDLNRRDAISIYKQVSEKQFVWVSIPKYLGFGGGAPTLTQKYCERKTLLQFWWLFFLYVSENILRKRKKKFDKIISNFSWKIISLESSFKTCQQKCSSKSERKKASSTKLFLKKPITFFGNVEKKKSGNLFVFLI